MNSRPLLSGSIVAVVTLALILTFCLDSKSEEASAEPQKATQASSTEKAAISGSLVTEEVAVVLTPAPFATFSTRSKGKDRNFVLSLTEGMERRPEGKDVVVPLDPPATLETLTERLSETGAANPVWPVCYEEGKPHTAAYRHIITSDLTLKLEKGEDEIDLPAGLVVTERPVYAPGHVVVSATDAFAAMAALQELQQAPGVENAELQLAVQRQKKTLPNDTFIGDQWHLKASGSASSDSDVNVENAWQYGASGGVRGSGVRIGIVDDGLQTAHPDLAANVDTTNDKDWNGDDNSPEPEGDDDHGTACAGNAGAVGNNNLGVSGTAPEATLVGMRLIAAGATDSQEAQALAYLPDLIEIKSNSWGPNDDGSTLEAPGSLTEGALSFAAETGRGGLGSIFLWAGGNGGEVDDNSNYDGYANNIHTIAVGATNSLGQQSYYSEPGANLVITAPSSGQGSALGITTTDRTGINGYSDEDYTDDFGGTSSSTPTAAGIVALMLEKNPSLGWRDVQEILIQSAAKIDSSDGDWTDNGAGFHFNHKYGAGLIDATAAVALADGWNNLATASSDSASETGLSLAIPDNNPAGLTRNLELTGENLRCEQVTLTVSLTHSFRGDLSITLISPAGTESRLAEERSDSSSNYSSWTFSSVRHWGENSAGTWTVRIADNAASDTGTLTALSLTAHGAPGIPTNPGPQVAINTPTTGSSFSPGATVTVSITASDVTADGSTGSVTSVELFDNGVSQGLLTSAPYQFSLTPGLGNHSLTATAIDSEGESASSSVVSFSVIDQAPTVTTASLSPASQAYSDEAIITTNLTASDPEESSLSFEYFWESSSDGVTWTDSEITGDTLPADPARAGLLWRAVVIANDGTNSSAPFHTAATNSLTRPPITASTGQSLSYLSGLVLRGSESTLARDAIINEFSQGVSGTSEWVEILVLRESSLRSWSLADSNSSTLTFSDEVIWDSVPAGTLIVIYNGSSKDSLLPADNFDASDGSLVLASTDGTFFTGSWPSFGNGGDSVRLSDDSGQLVAGFSYGSNSSVSPSLGAISSGKSAYFIGNDEAEASSAGSWKITTSGTARQLRGTRVPTSLPIAYGGSWSSLPTGFTSSGTSTYNPSLGTDTDPGSAKFDDSGDSLTIEFDAAASTLSYQLKGNTGGTPATSGTFVVEESTDGTTYSPLRTIIDQSTTDTAYSDSPSASARFLRFRYETKSSGNIQLDQVTLTAGDVGGPDSLGLSISPATFPESAGATAATATLSIAESLSESLTVTLSSSDSSAATVPLNVTIPAGQTSITFPVAAIDDSDADGTQFATITASAPDYADGSFDLTITDDEPSLEGVTPAAGNNLANLNYVEDLRSGAFNSPALFRLADGSVLPSGLDLDPLTGLISGTIGFSATVGDYPITIERYNTFSETVSQSFTLEVITGSGGYASWIAGEGVSLTGPNDDPDGDGLDNLLEYYLGGQAGVANATIAPTLPSVGTESLTIIFAHLKSATDVSGIVEWSDTLEPNSWSSTGVTIEVLDDQPTLELLQATIPVGGSPKRFARLRVE
ncbi:S8 family serine peptidase [Roseibacillus persicicus]|uniref:S8 family serine peptidase n=1 Tax=Roseibacillus persicicus TaxID=454148 RepID=UPI00280D435F|nr:S8 family serine peptidase [Roseibacillus persicicus]MDQ8189202.1 S8 family serine peptidase [Roseibacillus persicicus]